MKSPVANYAGYHRRSKRHNYRTLGVSPVILRLSNRLRSCSKVDVSEGADAFVGGGVPVEGGVEAEECCFAATEAGTNDIIEVAGFGAEVAGLLPGAFPLAAGPGPFM